MNEPIRKPEQAPESFKPQKPEIVNLMEEAQNSVAQQPIPEPVVAGPEIV